MSSQSSPSNSTYEPDFARPPPTLGQVAQTSQAILQNVVALNSGTYTTAVASVIVQEETEQLLRKNVVDHAMILRDHKGAIEDIKKMIARQKEVTASLEAALAVLEAVHGD